MTTLRSILSSRAFVSLAWMTDRFATFRDVARVATTFFNGAQQGSGRVVCALRQPDEGCRSESQGNRPRRGRAHRRVHQVASADVHVSRQPGELLSEDQA